MKIKIATWNCKGGINEDAKKKKVLENINADICVVQECLKTDVKEIKDDWISSNTSRGIGFFVNNSDFKLEQDINNVYPNICAARYAVKYNGKEIFAIVGVWLKQLEGTGSEGKYNRAMRSATPTLLEMIKKSPCIIMGDFNFWVGPYNGIEHFDGVKNPCDYTGDNDLFARYVCELYKRDLVSVQHVLLGELWGKERNKTHKHRSGGLFMDDYIFAPRTWITDSSKISIGGGNTFSDAEFPSDHMPLIFDFDILDD